MRTPDGTPGDGLPREPLRAMFAFPAGAGLAGVLDLYRHDHGSLDQRELADAGNGHAGPVARTGQPGEDGGDSVDPDRQPGDRQEEG
jgi:hypothetical protein